MSLAASLAARAVLVFARVLTGVQARWLGCPPVTDARVYFANHTSHGDFVLIWGALPPALRALTRPVAGADYWDKSPLRRFIGRDVFRALLIDRTGGATERAGSDPIALMKQELENGYSLIVFPEGTRNTTDTRLLPFKSGIFRLAALCPDTAFVPVWIDNLNRVLPKGESVPVPMLCTVTFGQPLKLAAGETKEVFLARCTQALLSLAPELD